jgi:hypothetical protein
MICLNNGQGIFSSTPMKIVAIAWETAPAGSGIAPIDVHTLLWLWSRAEFPPIVS